MSPLVEQILPNMAISDVDQARAAHDSEGALIEAALGGDGLAFRRLVEPHLGMLYRIAMRVSGRPQIAEEAVQETLALTFQRLPSYRHDTPFRAFLAAIASRQAHTLARSERRRLKREQAAEGPEAPPDPEEELRGARAARQVRQALGAMTDKRRQAALMRLDAGLSYRDIGQALGSSEGAARVLVHTALKDLRARLANLLSHEDDVSRDLP